MGREKKEMEFVTEEMWKEIAAIHNLPSARGWSLPSGEYMYISDIISPFPPLTRSETVLHATALPPFFPK